MAMIQPATLVLDGGDPRISNDHVVPAENYSRRKVSFEEYMYYAAITRAEEKEANKRFIEARGRWTFRSILKAIFSKGEGAAITDSPTSAQEKAEENAAARGSIQGRYQISVAQEKTASRAMRTASWGAIFYLITTDILGPTSAPWAFAQLGYGPGIALYTVFGVLSYYSGWIVYQVFLGLDSDKYPVRGYGDFFFRLFGPVARHFINVCQSIQMLLTVSVLILSNGQSISQISRGPAGDNLGLCFVVCLLIYMVAGFVLGQIRTLQRLGWLANISVWLNVVMILLCMGTVGYGPNYAAVKASFGLEPGPIRTFAGTPPDGFASGGTGFIASLNGLNTAVYAYGGAMLFAALLAEMRHPLDFWKGLLIAEIFIYAVYIFFGVFVYSYQGQFAYNPSVQGSSYWVALYSAQTAANILAIITALIAAVLYSNIGLKVVYIEVFHELLGFPDLTVRKGKIWWAVMIPVYWAIAFIIAASVPAFSYVVSLVGALFILSFTYTFPAWMALGYWIKRDAMIEGTERFDPTTGTYNYVDHGFSRWKRGFMKRPLLNAANFVYFLGALVTCGLGCYSAIQSLRTAFESGAANSLSCLPPL
ncbi:uncharacterized protein JN550_007606 [Neoarthrinium moseri]|uniref:uncharacterized protein n=1 Tax=Neoarthrinium moseri TaxID=1658444 RepID=UPI001FDB84D8|nr:uncharacterized protein JN550_007606 [Neoarthrinium moseri]KAI1866753.1 hypothetical protein JN550_007606 [Neoarthrinium moseri]